MIKSDQFAPPLLPAAFALPAHELQVAWQFILNPACVQYILRPLQYPAPYLRAVGTGAAARTGGGGGAQSKAGTRVLY